MQISVLSTEIHHYITLLNFLLSGNVKRVSDKTNKKYVLGNFIFTQSDDFAKAIAFAWRPLLPIFKMLTVLEY